MRSFSTLLLLTALVLLSACDSADSVADLVSPATFEATITSSSGVRSVTGESLSLTPDELGGSFLALTVGDPGDEQTFTILRLVADDSDEEFLFIGAQPDALVKDQTYSVGFNRIDEQGNPVGFQPEFVGVYLTDDATTFGLADGGSLTFSNVGDQMTLAGRFAFTTRETFGQDGNFSDQEIEVEGSFVATQREAPKRDGTR